MAVQLVDGMFRTLENAITEQVATNFQALYSVILPVWTAGVLIYFVVVAWEIIYSEKQIIVSEFIKHFLIIAVVSTFMGASAIYTADVVPFVMNAGPELGGYIVGGGGGGGSTGQLIDQMIETIIDIGNKEYEHLENSGFLDKVGSAIMFAVKIVILIIFAGAFILYAAAYLIMAMVMVGILLSLGGIFISFAAFPSTRQMFTSWVGSCFNYIFLNIAYSILFSILIKYLDKFITNNSASSDDPNNLWYIVLIAFTFAVGSFLLQQVASLMSILTGGVGINGLTGSVNGFMGKAASATGLRAAGSFAGKMAGKGLGNAGSGAGRAAMAGLNRLMGKGGIKGG